MWQIVNRTKCHGHDLPRIARNLSILALGIPWASFWEGLGHSWARLGCSCRLLDVSWEPLGRPLGGLGRLLGASWVAWMPLRRILSDLKSILKGFRKGLEGIWMGSEPQNNWFWRIPSLYCDGSGVHGTTNSLASGLQLASAGCAKRKQFCKPTFGAG